MFFFGPESEKPPRELPDEPLHTAPSPNDSINTAPRKQPRDAISNGLPEALSAHPAPKRGRKTAASSERNGSVARKPSASAQRAANLAVLDSEMVNGHVLPISDARSPSATEPGPDDVAPLANGIKGDERMDIDEESSTVDHHNHESHLDVLPPPVHTLLTGASKGIQVAPAKVANLSQSSAILNLPTTTNNDVSKSLTRVAWRPGDTRVLTALGEDFCGFWSIGDKPSDSSTPPPFQELVESAQGKLTSAVAWEPSGDMFAVATYSEQSGDIHLFDGQELGIMESLAASQRAITCLLWDHEGPRLLGIAPYDSDNSDAPQQGGSSILRWDFADSLGLAEPATLLVPEILMDMDSTYVDGNGVICAAGQNAVYYCRASPDFGIEQKWTSEPGGSDQWTFVRCASSEGTNAILVAASAETGSLWMPAQGLLKRRAHEAPITGLEIRPRLPNMFSATWKQDFATSSMDGTIKIWRYDGESSSIMSVCKLIIAHGSPIMALSYSPDGFCLAGASYDVVRIWNAEHDYHHMATWKDEESSWNGSRLKDDDMMSMGGRSSVNGDTGQTSADHTLTWDGESKKLAFGLGSQVSFACSST